MNISSLAARRSSATRSSATLFSLICLAFLSQDSALAAAPQYPDKAYEATIENCASNSTTHSWSDGKGHMRSETNIGGVNRASIIDFINKVTYSIDDQNKMVMKMPFTGSPENDPKVNWQPLSGTRILEGHPCTGKRAITNGTDMEVWTGTDTGCSVLVMGNGKPIMKLKTWKATTPNPSLFVPPTAYKTMDMSNMMKQK